MNTFWNTCDSELGEMKTITNMLLLQTTNNFHLKFTEATPFLKKFIMLGDGITLSQCT